MPKDPRRKLTPQNTRRWQARPLSASIIQLFTELPMGWFLASMKFQSMLFAALFSIFLAGPAWADTVEWSKIADLIDQSSSKRFDGSDVSPEQRKTCQQLLQKTFDTQRQEVYKDLPTQAERVQSSFLPLLVDSKDKAALPVLHKMFEQGHEKYSFLGGQIIKAVATIGGDSERPFIGLARHDKNIWTRLEVARALGKFSKDHEALIVLSEMLGLENDNMVKREIIDSMGNFNGEVWAEHNLDKALQEEKATLKTIETALTKLKKTKPARTAK